MHRDGPKVDQPRICSPGSVLRTQTQCGCVYWILDELNGTATPSAHLACQRLIKAIHGTVKSDGACLVLQLWMTSCDAFRPWTSN